MHKPEEPTKPPLISEFLGTVHAWPEHIDAMKEIGLGWTRLDVPWAQLQPRANKSVDLSRPTRQGNLRQRFAKIAEGRITLLPILGYSTAWAAAELPFAFESRGVRYDLHLCGQEEPLIECTALDLQSGEQLGRGPLAEMLGEPDCLPPADLQTWVDYCEYIVKTLSAPPYNLEYFQVWNEPTIEAGFFAGSPNDFVDRILIPAAEIIHSHHGKVVFSGWPCSNSLGEMSAVLNYNEAWRHVDILDVHYMPPLVFQWLYDEWIATGRCEGIWQTEVCSGISHALIPDEYPRVLHWALEHGLGVDDPHRYKLFFYCFPGDDRAPAGTGYDGAGLAFENENSTWGISRHGAAMQTLHRLLAGGSLRPFKGGHNNLSIGPTLDTRQESMEAFSVDDRLVVAIHLDQTHAYLRIDDEQRDLWHLSHPFLRRLRFLTLALPEVPIDAVVSVTRVSVRNLRTPLAPKPNTEGPGIVIDIDPTDTSEHVRAFAAVRPLVKVFYVEIQLTEPH